jgi:cellulose 1,4-beta-cellobiosidase
MRFPSFLFILGELDATPESLERYKREYIDVYRDHLLRHADPMIKVILIIEPDSLPNLATNMHLATCRQSGPYYHDGIAYALAQFSLVGNLWQYIDVGHGGWLGWTPNLKKIVPILHDTMLAAKQYNPLTQVRGYAT